MPLNRLKTLWNNVPPGDLATEDWSPIPVNATARPQDTMEWLLDSYGDPMPSQEDDGRGH